MGELADIFEEAFGEDGDIGFSETGGGEDIDHLVGGHGAGDQLADGGIDFFGGFGRAFAGAFGQGGADFLEEAEFVADSDAVGVGNGKGKGFGKVGDGLENVYWPVLKTACKSVKET